MHTNAESAAVFANPIRNVGALSVDKRMIIADFGAGSGHYTFEFARQLAGTGRVYAIDVQRDLLRRIGSDAHRRGFKNIETIAGDVERAGGTHLADRTADLALISNLLFQLADPAAALREAWRIVRPAGKVVVIDWSGSPPTGGRSMGPSKKHVVTKQRALELAASAGFELTREFDAGAHHYGLILKPMPLATGK